MSPDASEDRRAVFGLDLELEQKKIDKYSVEMEEEALQWIADLTGHAKDDHESVHNFLKDGTVLCDLINALEPNSVKKVHKNTSMAFKQMENINSFLIAAEQYGVPASDSFQTVDLYEAKHMGQVISAIHALGREAQRPGRFDGPVIGVRPSLKNERSFSEEVLSRSNSVISLQFGFNKGESQSGMIPPGGFRQVVVLPQSNGRP